MLPAPYAVGDETAHGSGGYTGAVLVVLHFVALRLTALKRTATMSSLVRLKSQTRYTRSVRAAQLHAAGQTGVNRKRFNITAHYQK